MLYLSCYVLSAVCFSQLFRYGQHRRPSVIPAAAVNYVVAMLLAAGWFVLVGGWRGPSLWFPVVMGLPAGTLYWVHLLIMFASFEIVGVGITTALVFTAYIVPILFAWAFWDNPVTGLQWLAVALLPVAAWLIRPAQPGPRRLTLKADLVLILVFSMAGVIATIHKSIDQFADASVKPAYNFSLFTCAAVGSVAYAKARGLRIGRVDLAVGAGAGTCNMLNLLLFLLALNALGTARFFPLSAVLVIGLNLLVSRFLWNERISRRQVSGLIVAAAIAGLINLNGGAGT